MIQSTAKFQVGDKLEIWVTGCTRIFDAEVISFDADEKPCLRVEGWAILKHGDYVITRHHRTTL